MNYIKEMEKFISEHRKAMCFILNLPQNSFLDSDLRIMSSYLTSRAGSKHTQSNGEIDTLFLDDIKKLPYEKRGELILIKAAEWQERGEILGKKMINALKSTIKFSPRLEDSLAELRKQKCKESFNQLSDNVMNLKRHMKTLTSLLKGPGSFEDPAFKFQLRQTLRLIQSDLQKCNYQARAGAVWAIKTGVEPSKAISAVNHIYLKHMDSLGRSFQVVDQLLESQGIKCAMSKQIDNIKNTWYQDIQDVLNMAGERKNENKRAEEVCYGN